MSVEGQPLNKSKLASLQFFLRVIQTSRLLVRWGRATLRVMDQTRNQLVRTTNFVVLAVGILLAAAAFLGIYYDARHGVPLYQGEVTTALPAHR